MKMDKPRAWGLARADREAGDVAAGMPWQFVTQTKLHSETVKGNCMSAVLATLFGGSCDDYNHIYDDLGTGAFHRRVEVICLDHGYLALRIAPSLNDGVPRGVYLASGPSPRGIRHVVIMENDAVLWDPHPSRAGLESVEYLTLLIPWIP